MTSFLKNIRLWWRHLHHQNHVNSATNLGPCDDVIIRHTHTVLLLLLLLLLIGIASGSTRATFARISLADFQSKFLFFFLRIRFFSFFEKVKMLTWLLFFCCVQLGSFSMAIETLWRTRWLWARRITWAFRWIQTTSRWRQHYVIITSSEPKDTFFLSLFPASLPSFPMWLVMMTSSLYVDMFDRVVLVLVPMIGRVLLWESSCLLAVRQTSLWTFDSTRWLKENEWEKVTVTSLSFFCVCMCSSKTSSSNTSMRFVSRRRSASESAQTFPHPTISSTRLASARLCSDELRFSTREQILQVREKDWFRKGKRSEREAKRTRRKEEAWYFWEGMATKYWNPQMCLILLLQIAIWTLCFTMWMVRLQAGWLAADVAHRSLERDRIFEQLTALIWAG